MNAQVCLLALFLPLSLSFTPPTFHFSTKAEKAEEGKYTFFPLNEEEAVLSVESESYLAFPYPYNETQLGFPLSYAKKEGNQTVQTQITSLQNEVYTDPYTQTVFFRTLLPGKEGGELTFPAKEGRKDVKAAAVSTLSRIEAVSLLSLPIYSMRTNGDAWRQLMHEWIFLLVSVIICILFIVAFRERLVEAAFLLSASFFLTSAGSKTYHAGLGEMLSANGSALAFTIGVVVLCIDILAALFCFVASLRAREKPYIWFVVTCVYAVALLFLGGGIYLGPSLMILSALFLIASLNSK